MTLKIEVGKISAWTKDVLSSKQTVNLDNKIINLILDHLNLKVVCTNPPHEDGHPFDEPNYKLEPKDTDKTPQR